MRIESEETAVYDRGPWMQTITGKRFYLREPSTEDVDIRDIAHALSMTCRYGGHSPRFYSVAEHSVHCARLAEKRGATPDLQLAVLLHDGAEAYCGDLVSPLKAALRPGDRGILPHDFDAIEDVIQQCVNAALFGWTHFDDPLIRACDLAIGAAECLAFGIEITPGREMEAPSEFLPQFWSPATASRWFIRLFTLLMKEEGYVDGVPVAEANT